MGHRTHCQYCGAGPFKSVGHHEFQCSENPDGKTEHYERFKKENRGQGQVQEQGQAPAQGSQPPRSEPPTGQNPPPAQGQTGQDRPTQGQTGGVSPVQFEPTHGMPEDQGTDNSGDDGYNCPKCPNVMPEPYRFCPDCEAGPLKVAG